MLKLVHLINSQSYSIHQEVGLATSLFLHSQRYLALLDAGGNVVLADSESTCYSRVIIDTSNNAIPSVTEVVFANSIVDDARLMYGPGDIIQIDVIFSREVTLFQTNSSTDSAQCN